MIIAVNNNKGGSLKTTTTTNLAGVLALKEKKVLIVDSDSQSNVAMSFGKNPDEFRTTLYDVLVDDLPAEDSIVKVHKYIDILPSNAELISFDFDVIGSPDTYPEPFSIMKNRLQHLRKDYDYILIDTPPSLSLMVGNAFAFADRILIPYTPEFYSMRSLMEVVRTIREFKEEYNPSLDVLAILRVIVNTNTNLHTDITQQTNRYAYENDIPLLETIIPRTIQFANAVAYHQLPATLVKQSRSFDKAELYVDVWNEIESILKEGVEA